MVVSGARRRRLERYSPTRLLHCLSVLYYILVAYRVVGSASTRLVTKSDWGTMGYNFNAVRVLIADDSPHLHEIFKVLLGAMRIKDVRFVRHPNDALARMALSAPDVVITDLTLGVHDGIDLVRRIRNGENNVDPYTPIIVITGRTETDLVEHARDNGANEVLARPVSADCLYNRIVSMIERPRFFIQAPTYFGPDRRRQTKPYEGRERRKQNPVPISAVAAFGKAERHVR